MQVRFLSWEDPFGEDMATHSSILAWEIPWTEKPGGLQPMRSQKGQTQFSSFSYFLSAATPMGNGKNTRLGLERTAFES